MAKYLTDLADVLRRAGLDVVEMPGWKTRGRPGDFDPKGVLCHHTAGAGDGYNDAWAMATVGRPDLSAPLAQLALSRKGVWYVLAAGRANHAGKCKAVGGLTAGDGNEQMLGVEAQNRGTDAEDWTPTQYGSYVRGVAALTEHYGWRPPLGHKETSTSGKVDPDFPMDQFRRDVAAAKGDTSMSAQDVSELKDYLQKVLVTGYTVGDKSFPGIAAVDIENQRRLTVALNQITALTETVKVLAESNGANADEILALIKAKLDGLTLAVVDKPTEV